MQDWLTSPAIGALAAFAAVIGLIVLVIVLGEKHKRKVQIRRDRHMANCTRGEDCYHPDHIHEYEPPPLTPQQKYMLEQDELEAWRDSKKSFLERWGS